MKSHFLLPMLLLFPFFFSNAQEESIYFPQEQLIIKECENSENNSECLYNYLEQKTRSFLLSNEIKRKLLKVKKDTLKVSTTFYLNNEGEIIKSHPPSWLGDKLLYKKLEVYDELITNTKLNSIKNKKPDSLMVAHNFRFNYLIKKSNDVELILISNEKKYTGGIIEEKSRFPGCENLNEQDARSCFQNKILEHIKGHFRYPKKAMKKKIQGRVAVIFDINKKGEIENIRTRGPHQILEDEVHRIISLLPNLIPAKNNGETVLSKYSIPITFKL